MFVSRILFAGEENGDVCQLVACVVLLLIISARHWREAEAFAFLHYIECITPLDNPDVSVGGICVRWSILGDMYHTIETNIVSRKNQMRGREWFWGGATR